MADWDNRCRLEDSAHDVRHRKVPRGPYKPFLPAGLALSGLEAELVVPIVIRHIGKAPQVVPPHGVAYYFGSVSESLHECETSTRVPDFRRLPSSTG